MDPLQTSMYSIGMMSALGLLVSYLRSVDGPRSTSQDALIDRFIPVADIAESHEILIHAPADIVFQVAENFDLQSIPIVRAIFRLREKLFGVKPLERRQPKGLVAETMALGWGLLAYRSGRELIAGAVTKPWVGDVKFRSIPADQFASFAEAGFAKIVWTLEADPLDTGSTRFRAETRVLATDDAAVFTATRVWRT
jgi:hypothetical protein